MKQTLNVRILNLDGVPDKSGDFFDKTSVIRCNQPDVPLLDTMGNYIGIAKPVPKKLLWDFFSVDLQFFDGVSPAMYSLKPCFNGKCTARMVDHILEAEFTSVTLSFDNADQRIPTIGSYFGISDQPKSVKPGLCMCERLLNGHDDGCGWARKQNG